MCKGSIILKNTKCRQCNYSIHCNAIIATVHCHNQKQMQFIKFSSECMCYLLKVTYITGQSSIYLISHVNMFKVKFN